MPGPSKHLERTRGRILGEAEQVRVASQVQVVSGGDCIERTARGRLFLALTDRRLLLVGDTLWRRRPDLLLERPTGRLSISMLRRKVGANLIRIVPADPSGEPTSQAALIFEWVSGHKPLEWANLRFRQGAPRSGRS